MAAQREEDKTHKWKRTPTTAELAAVTYLPSAKFQLSGPGTYREICSVAEEAINAPLLTPPCPHYLSIHTSPSTPLHPHLSIHTFCSHPQAINSVAEATPGLLTARTGRGLVRIYPDKV